jgi:hypothetical protein
LRLIQPDVKEIVDDVEQLVEVGVLLLLKGLPLRDVDLEGVLFVAPMPWIGILRPVA